MKGKKIKKKKDNYAVTAQCLKITLLSFSSTEEADKKNKKVYINHHEVNAQSF